MEWLIYLLKVSVSMALFFAFYLLMLRRLTFFKLNRFYLLLSLVMSFVIPALQFTIERESTPVLTNTSVVLGSEDLPIEALPSAIMELSPIPINVSSYFNLPDFMLVAYLLMSFALLSLSIRRLFILFREASASAIKVNGLKIIPKHKGFTNCSFFNYVFIDEHSLSEKELHVLLKHEEVHAKQFHSIDKIILMVMKAVLWFNPIIFFYDKALEQAHEYEADEIASGSIGIKYYANLLIRFTISKSSTPLVHNFVNSPLKLRIKMLFKLKSKRMKKFVYLLALPIGLGLIWGFTIDVVKVLPSAGQEKEFILVIDAGHGGKQKGTQANGVSEKEITLTMSKKIKAIAEERGMKVITTRNDDKHLGLQERVKAKGSFLISLHVNAEPGGGVLNGIEMFIPTTSDKVKSTGSTSDKIRIVRSISMTNDLYRSLSSVNGIKTSGKTKSKRLYILENSIMPVVTLELGYLTNKSDFQFITNDQKQNELATAIVDGVLNYKKHNKSDEELKAMIGKSKRKSDLYLAWKNSDKYKLITAKAAKIRSESLKGKIESFHYFSDNKIFDGFILNVSGERYRVYLSKEQREQYSLNKGDLITVKTVNAEVWYDSDYPVIKPIEILIANRV